MALTITSANRAFACLGNSRSVELTGGHSISKYEVVLANADKPVEPLSSGNPAEAQDSAQKPGVTSVSFWTQNPFYYTLLVIVLIAVVSSYFLGLAAAGWRLSKNSKKK